MLALCLMTGALASCDKDEDKIVVTASSLATPKVSATTVAIDPEQLSATALTLTWDKVNFTPSSILAKNDIVISVEGKTPIIFPVGEGNSHSFTAQALNEILIEQFKLTPGKATPVLFTVRTYPNNGNTPAQPSGSSLAVSQPITVTITPAAVVTERVLVLQNGMLATMVIHSLRIQLMLRNIPTQVYSKLILNSNL